MTSSSSAHGVGWCRAALDTVDHAVVAADAEGRVTFLNETAEALTGWTRADATGLPADAVLRLVDERTGGAVDSPAGRALREGARFEVCGDVALLTKDGAHRPVHGVVAPIRDEAGRVEGVVATLLDVSRRRAAEHDLRAAEESFRLLVESTVDYAIFLLDPTGHVATWNPGAERIKGWRRDEIVGRHFSIFYPPAAIEADWPATELREATARGRFEDEGWRVRKDGTRFWANVVITALRDESGRLRGFAKITRDLTERRAAEEAIRSREERFRAVAESATDAIVVCDQAGRVTFWNAAAVRTFGYAAAEMTGRSAALVLPGPAHSEFQRILDDLNAGRGAEHVGRTEQLVARRKTGEEIPVEASLSTWTTHEGARFYCATARDVTERRQLERARVQAEVMSDLDRRKDEFLAMLSHELRNPLSPIVNALHLLRLGNEDPVQRQARAVIERQVGQLTRLVDDLLEVSRILTGGFRLRQELCDLRRIVERAVETVRPMLQQHRHHLETEFAEAEVWVSADPTRIEQVAVNLLTNAIKYTPDEGHVRVAVSAAGEHATLVVRDDGIGIPGELLPRVFDLFTQGQRSLDRSQGGLGVGLTVVRRIVEMHGGSVTASSAGTGRGSEFVVRLPLTLAASERPPEDAGSIASPAGALRVLVVDDNQDAAEMLAVLLRAARHHVRTAYDGLEAVAVADTFRPEVVFLDIGLPGIDGYEVARRLRERTDLRDLRLVAVSGYGQEKDRARSRAAGFDEHLVKPVDPQRVFELLSER